MTNLFDLTGKVAIITHPYNQRTASSGHNNLTRHLPVNYRHSKGPFNLGHGLSDRLVQVSVKVMGDEVGQDLCVRL